MEILDSNGLTEKQFLESYDASKYERPSVTNDILIFTADNKKEENPRKVAEKGLQVLLIKRKDHPYINKWAIPGGFVNMTEDLRDGALRELQEETGIDNVYTEQLYTFGDLYKDKEKKILRDPRTRVVSIANVALIPKSSVNPVAGDDAKEVQWFWINKKLLSRKVFEKEIVKIHLLELLSEDNNERIVYEVKEIISKDLKREKEVKYTLLDDSNNELSFDHYKMLDQGVDRLRNKIEYTPIAFNLLPELFTVKELQNLYEAILGREIQNFKRKMQDMILETEEKEEGVPHKPAKYYRFNESFEHEF